MVAEKAALFDITPNGCAQIHERHERDPAAKCVQKFALHCGRPPAAARGSAATYGRRYGKAGLIFFGTA